MGRSNDSHARRKLLTGDTSDGASVRSSEGGRVSAEGKKTIAAAQKGALGEAQE